MDSQTTTSQKIDVYQIVTDQIISFLNQGIIPWQKSWGNAGMPINAMSKRQYRGINVWLLLSHSYERNLFLTWDQLKGLGASVNAGEHGHVVVYWHVPKSDGNGEDKAKSTSSLRYYKVFNVAQCRDLPESRLPQADQTKVDFDPVLECEGIINTMPNCPVIQHKEQNAYYSIDTDVINMPKKKTFKPIETYYCTLFHELVHSTGSERRLGRKTLDQMVPFGETSYTMEQLIAEMGSAFLCNFSGILPNQIVDTVAYLQNWSDIFRSDKRFLLHAAAEAQKATDNILNRKGDEPKDELG